MTPANSVVYEFDKFRLDTGERMLFRDNVPLNLQPKTYELLYHLVKHNNQLLTRDDLIEELWADTYVGENNLSQHVRRLRGLIGDEENRMIETVPRRGYRFNVEVRSLAPNGHAVRQVPSYESVTEPADTPVRRGKRKRVIAAVAIVVSVLLVSGVGFYLWRERGVTEVNLFAGANYQTIAGAISGAISPDGKHVTYVTQTGNNYQLWLKRVASEQAIPISKATEKQYNWISFSHDGEQIFYTQPTTSNTYRLSRIPIFGGSPVAVLERLSGMFSLSKDDSHAVFGRTEDDQRSCSLVLAELESKVERTLATRDITHCYEEMAWSPEGDTIAVSVGNSDSGRSNNELVEIAVADGTEKLLTNEKWQNISDIVWIPKYNGLLVTGRKDRPAEPLQIWFVNRVTGKVDRLTDDATNYKGLTASADGRQIVSKKVDLDSHLSVALITSPNDSSPLIPAAGRIAWLTNDKIVHIKYKGRSTWVINSDGSEPVQLATEEDIHVTASPDFRYILSATAMSDAFHIFRMNADGSDRIQLTDGAGEQYPTVSADGRWVYYESVANSRSSVWKVSIDGGDPVVVVPDNAVRPSGSPDGKFLAYHYLAEGDAIDTTIAIMSLETGDVVYRIHPSIDAFGAGRIAWAADSSSIYYAAVSTERADNIWRHPITSGAPERITNFTTDKIFDFELSPAGTHLAMVRGNWLSGLVLITLPENTQTPADSL
ncbi:MAG: winged helix-turn-helix domain-containing protein [Pyrinomonadaceae bacterium]